MKYGGWTMTVPGTWGHVLGPGPASFQQWRRLRRVFAIAMEMLGFSRAVALAAYAEHIRALDAEDPRCGGMIATAGVHFLVEGQQVRPDTQ